MDSVVFNFMSFALDGFQFLVNYFIATALELPGIFIVVKTINIFTLLPYT